MHASDQKTRQSGRRECSVPRDLWPAGIESLSDDSHLYGFDMMRERDEPILLRPSYPREQQASGSRSHPIADVGEAMNINSKEGHFGRVDNGRKVGHPVNGRMRHGKRPKKFTPLSRTFNCGRPVSAIFTKLFSFDGRPLAGGLDPPTTERRRGRRGRRRGESAGFVFLSSFLADARSSADVSFRQPATASDVSESADVSTDVSESALVSAARCTESCSPGHFPADSAAALPPAAAT